MYDLYGSLGNLAILKNRKSRAINLLYELAPKSLL